MQKDKRGTPTPKFYFFGPGIGECIAIQLPDGQWGVVDCFISSKKKGIGILEFLEKKGVDELAFFCLTHPHADHYMGAEQLLARYAGRIRRIWRYDGLVTKELQARTILAARVQQERRGDPEARQLADGFLAVVQAISETRHEVAEYRRVTAPTLLMKTKLYEIEGIRPCDNMIEDIEDRVLRKNANDGYLIFDDEDGGLLNSLSVVLRFNFPNSRVLLLGDAEGPHDPVDLKSSKLTLIKVAHHGSTNGLGAEHFRTEGDKTEFACSVITPYSRSSLPGKEMVERVSRCCGDTIITGGTKTTAPRDIPPGLDNPRLVDTEGEWHGVEITDGGLLRCE